MSRECAGAGDRPRDQAARAGGTPRPVDALSDDMAPARSVVPAARGGDLERLIERAAALRPLLRREQQATEDRGHYSREVHDIFWNEGFYRVLGPQTFGGLQLGVAAFFRVIAEVARGCPSTAWCLCLGAGHTLQMASYFPASGQEKVFGSAGQSVAASSSSGRDVTIRRAGAGCRLSGTWRYCSGSPWSTHFMPVAPGPDDPDETWWLLLDRSQYEVVDDWGQVIGMRGSGSNSIRVDDAYVADDMIVRDLPNYSAAGPSAGSVLHGDPVYAGAFRGFAEGEVAAVAAGLAMAAIDALGEILGAGAGASAPSKAATLDAQRSFGLALAAADGASALSLRGGRLYEEFARASAEGGQPFSAGVSLRLANMYFTSERLSWEAIDQVLRAAGSSAMLRGRPLERYARDALTIRSRTDQLDPAASVVGRIYLNASRSGPVRP